MLDAIVRQSLAHRWLVLGRDARRRRRSAPGASRRLPIDAVPDITNVQVQINTEAPGYSPLEAEQRITFPIETAIAGLPRLEYTRSLSRYGLSQVTVVFEDGTDIYFARQLVNERLREAHVAPARRASSPSSGRSRRGSARSSCSPSRRSPAPRDEHGRPMRPDRPAHAPGLGDQAAAPHGARRHRGEHDRRLREGGPRDAAARAAGRARAHLPRPRSTRSRATTLGTGAGYIEHNGEQYLVRAPGQLARARRHARASWWATRGGVPIRVGDVAEVGARPASCAPAPPPRTGARSCSAPSSC